MIYDRTPNAQGILVTGSTGYLGCHVVAQLHRLGQPVLGMSRAGGDISCDMLDQQALQAALERHRPKVVVHCAAVVPGRGNVGYDDEVSAEANTEMLRNLLRAGAQRVVFISSMTVYAPHQRMPVKELETAPQSAYAEGKVACENLLHALGEHNFGAILRLPGLFGPPRRSGLVYSLCDALIAGKPIRLPEAPTMWAAMHVEDAAIVVARAALAVAEKETWGVEGRYIVANVGYSGKFSISRLIDELAGLTRANLRSPIEHPDFAMDLMTLARSFGLPKASFRQRLEEMLEYAGTARPACNI